MSGLSGPGSCGNFSLTPGPISKKSRDEEIAGGDGSAGHAGIDRSLTLSARRSYTTHASLANRELTTPALRLCIGEGVQQDSESINITRLM